MAVCGILGLMIANNRLLRAKVWHLREKPKRNEFTYSVFYIAHLLNTPETKKSPLFSYDRFNLLSLHKKDLGPKDGSEWLPWVTEQFKQGGVLIGETDNIEVITHPRLFGYAFNPISFWILFNEREEIKAVLCEVHNTFKETHNYLLKHDDGRVIAATDVFEAAKKMYVSPFNKIEGYYKFSFLRTEQKFKADIHYYVGENPVVQTAVAGNYATLSTLGILQLLLLYPMMTVMVIVRIHWQALKLYVKKVPHTLPIKPKVTSENTTVGKQE